MVKKHSLHTAVLVFTLFTITLTTGCGFRKIWGEGRRKIVSLREKISGSGCPSAKVVLNGTESESKEAFDCLRKQVDGLWTQIQTEKPGIINNQEIALL